MSGPPGQTHAPVIIAGMHRSGTTLLSRMLRELGVFLGRRRETNEEARTFLEINKWLLLQAGHAWDTPPDENAFADPTTRELCTRYMRYTLNSIWMSFYLGKPWYSRHTEAPQFGFPWGWKDPRNTLTLPLWAEIYPQARLIQVRRHGVDVARSLVQRHQRRIHRVKTHFDLSQRLFWLGLRHRRFETSCANLEQAFSLWQRYQESGIRGAGKFTHTLDIRFEDLLDQSESTLTQIINFLQLDPTEQQLEAARSLPRPGRSLAYRKDQDLQAFASNCSEILLKYGYEP